jgi:glucose-1-phosphate cytidylyltransferase
MKVVLFCGGLGTRLREHSDTVPKPLVNIGVRPIIWHLMRYYAHYGHTEFILCLGYRGDMVREYFLKYEESLSNDFTLHGDSRRVELHSTDISGWKITFVDTGLHTNIGQRLLKVRSYLAGEEHFLANYADGLSDLPLDAMIADFHRQNVIGSLAAINGWHSFHTLDIDDAGFATRLGAMRDRDLWINGGYFMFHQKIFDYIKAGEELVEQPLNRLVEQRKLAVYRHAGFWRAMDTLKDKISFDRMEATGDCPWMVWKQK